MRDRLFTGADVAEALAAAAQTLGLPQRELRYVVLEQGCAGGRGLQPTRAQVAVLLQEGTRPVTPAPAAVESEGQGGEPPLDWRAGIRGVVRAMAEAAGSDIACELDEQGAVLLVELRGDGCAALYGEEADGEPLRALEHLLLRMYGEDLRPLALRVRCEGFRERREAVLGGRVRRLAAQVRDTGEPCVLEPMNAYERRLVHIAIQDEPGVRTQSDGEGRDRRVQIVPVTMDGVPRKEPAASAEAAGRSGAAEDAR